MTLRADMVAGITDVLQAFCEGETWTYAPLSSLPGIKPPTYGTAVAFTYARTVSRNAGQEWDERSNSFIRRERVTITTNGITMVANQGDEISDGTLKWAIESFIIGYSHTHWTLIRDLPHIQSRPAQGGV